MSSQLSVQKGKVDELESALHRVQVDYNESQELVELIEQERNVSALLRVKVVDMPLIILCVNANNRRPSGGRAKWRRNVTLLKMRLKL